MKRDGRVSGDSFRLSRADEEDVVCFLIATGWEAAQRFRTSVLSMMRV